MTNLSKDLHQSAPRGFVLSGIHCLQFGLHPFETKLYMVNEPHHEKTNVLVSDLVRHKPGCTATEGG